MAKVLVPRQAGSISVCAEGGVSWEELRPGRGRELWSHSKVFVTLSVVSSHVVTWRR